MKVHLLGRSSYSYLISRCLRRLGHESHFFHEPDIHPRISLGWDVGSFPDEEMSHITAMDFVGSSPFTPAGREILRRIGDCDILHCTGLSAYWAVLTGKPMVYHAFGGDLSVWLFKGDTPEERARRFMMQAIIRNASAYLGLRHAKSRVALFASLGIDPSKDHLFFYPVDDEVFNPLSEERRRLVRRELDCSDKFVAFLPSQLWFRPLPTLNAAKGTELFLEGFINATRAGAQTDFELWAVRRGVHSGEFLDLVRRAGIADKVRLFEPMPKGRLVELYGGADVVFDQIFPDIGNQGALTCEALACGKPVFIHIDQEHRRAIGEPEIPVVNVRTTSDVTAHLLDLAKSPDKIDRIAKDALAFISAHHNWRASTSRLIAVYESVLEARTGRGGFDQDRPGKGPGLPQHTGSIPCGGVTVH